ncbi:MAG: N-6 DNA methylase [Thermoleophilia bacterium]
MTSETIKIIEQYVGEVLTQYKSGHAKEHAYRPALERLMTSFENVTAINDPKRSAHGNPDFVFLNKSNRDIILGYAEAKDIDISLDKTEKTDQMRRYGGYENLFLTNYIEFRFFQNGNKYQTIVIGKLKNGKLKLNPAMYDQLADELAQFLALPPESIKSGKRLAQIMGAKARRIRDNVQLYLAHEDDERNQELEKMYNMMKELLVHDLTTETFADMYAQTLVYGLFVARFNDTTPENFDRKEARDLVPSSNPFLSEFFDHIVGPRFDKRLAYIVDELCEVFSVSDVNALVHKHLKLFEVGDEKDPIIHFYEDFLKEYDPDVRKQMGAYYTPLPVVRFIIKNVDEILKKDFGLPRGLADTSKKKVTLTSQGKNYKQEMHKVQILDPAVGTATFLNEIIKHIFAGFKGQQGRWPSYVLDDLLPRIHGFELMMAPYTIAHLKLDMTLQESGVKDLKRRLGVYLTNTLEEGFAKQPDLFSFGLADIVSKEAEEAAKIKHERPIMIVMGNPPYFVESANKTEFAASLVSKYKTEPGGRVKLKERNSKMINDDYVKFIAFAEEMITKNGEGIVAMITNNGYLSNPTFRGMRWHLATSFDKIFVLNLHGNSKIKETAPDGGKDENVFDIQQGVAIILAIRTLKKRKGKIAQTYFQEIYGTREHKFTKLAEKINFINFDIEANKYFQLHPINTADEGVYEKYIDVSKVFMSKAAGIKTSSDSVSIAFSKTDLRKQIEACSEIDVFNESKIKRILYRPFDMRYIYYDAQIVKRDRYQQIKHSLS